MKTRNRKIERNPLAALIALIIFSLIVMITIIVQLGNFLLNDKSLLRIPETTHTNQDPDPLALHAHLEPPQPVNREIVHYFNPRFRDIPDVHFLKKQIRENIDAVFVGAVVPWPEIMEAGFGHGALAAIDREVKLQGGGGEDGNGTRGMGNDAHARDGEKDGDTPEWMLALFPKPEDENGNGNGNGNENENVDTSPGKKGGEKPREQKSTCPICTDELPAKVAVAKPCKHRFCKSCLADWMVHLGEGKEAICSCPVCGVGIRRVGGGGVRGFVRGVLRRGL
ncbi:hypothetical protein ACHAP3_000718 [Botrytis cinerea]